MVLLGMVPVLIQTPPTTLRISTSATRFPLFTAETAARCPEGPEPMTIRSYVSMRSPRCSGYFCDSQMQHTTVTLLPATLCKRVLCFQLIPVRLGGILPEKEILIPPATL